MKQLLLRVTFYLFLAQLAGPGTAVGQYLFNDTDGDGDCDYDDYIEAPLDTVTIWLDTNHFADGTTATCPTGEELSISGYELVLHGSSNHGGSITLGTWTNLIPEFTNDLGTFQSGNDMRVSYASHLAATFLPPGKYRLGRLTVQSTGGICDHFVGPAMVGQFGQDIFDTGFFSQCPGEAGYNKVRLGLDFSGVCGGGVVCSDVKETTWGKIKRQYR